MHYKSDEYLAELMRVLVDYIPNHFPDNTKPKIVADAVREYSHVVSSDRNIGIYDLNMMGLKLINDIGTSHLLGCNEVIIDPLVEEYKALKVVLTDLMTELPRLNRFPDLKPHIPKFKSKDASTALFHDLTQLCEEYDIECNIKELVKSI